MGRSTFKRYSKVALDAAKQALQTVDMGKVWAIATSHPVAEIKQVGIVGPGPNER